MLNLPLALLSDDLLGSIVEHLYYEDASLHSLSLADRAFTNFCQTYIFQTLQLGDPSGSIPKRIKKMRKILNEKPSFADRVCKVHLSLSHDEYEWLFKDGTLIDILRMLAKSPTPPYELHVTGSLVKTSNVPLFRPLYIEEPILLTVRLSQSFFPQTVTILHLRAVYMVPLLLILNFPKLRELNLNNVLVSLKSDDTYPDEQGSGREAPALEVLDSRESEGLVMQMISPPPMFHTPSTRILWSNLRILRLCPQKGGEMGLLQSVLDKACDTLEELILVNGGRGEQLNLAELVDLSNLSRLRVFALCSIIKLNPNAPSVLPDTVPVLNTIPASNKITSLLIHFRLSSEYPSAGSLNHVFVEVLNQVIRISAGKPLNLEFDSLVDNFPPAIQSDSFYRDLKESTVLLSDFPEISIQSCDEYYTT